MEKFSKNFQQMGKSRRFSSAVLKKVLRAFLRGVYSKKNSCCTMHILWNIKYIMPVYIYGDKFFINMRMCHT